MRLTITYGLALLAGVLALTRLDKPTSIMFNPATDGPIRFEEKASYSAFPATGTIGTCLTSMSTDGGRSVTAVYTPCATSATSAFSATTTAVTSSVACTGGCSR